mmetsp:Transcript_324/g.997  ORF Transcript_324/g.997 Transcript_324/m.997 type:complete len:230 (+) Transcript_324:322-1011(+)|eukprot:scaffold316242_cov28-Tisochrysis_lutea.AAC.2
MTIAEAPPPPLQIPATPIFPPLSLSTESRVTTILAPDAPIGWPRATAPPRIFTLFGSSPRSLLFAKDTTENASLISKKSTEDTPLRPALASARGIAADGAVVNHSGSCSASPKPRIVAKTVAPCAFAAARDMRTSAAAPSEIVDAFAAVTVPPSRLKAGFALDAGLGGCAISSSRLMIVSPLRDLTVTGTTSSSKLALRARLYDSSACASCMSLVMPWVSAQSSAYVPM